jgi:hypothetical protein
MCTEFLLVSIYFFIILFVNIFLFRLLKNYTKKISYLSNFKNIFKIYGNKNFKPISFFHFLSIFILSKKFNFKFTENFLKDSFLKNKINLKVSEEKYQKKWLQTKDVILLNNLYDFLDKKNQKDEKTLYYFKLIKYQYGGIIDRI